MPRREWPTRPDGADGGWLTASMYAPLTEIIAPDWAEALRPVENRLHEIGGFLREEVRAGRGYLPAG